MKVFIYKDGYNHYVKIDDVLVAGFRFKAHLDLFIDSLGSSAKIVNQSQSIK